MRDYIAIAESLFTPKVIDGWWINERGEMLECDHRVGYHHADVAKDAFGIETEEDDTKDRAGDYAMQVAMEQGWVRGSWYDGVLAVAWSETLSTETTKTFLNWMKDYAPAFKTIIVEQFGDDETFDNAAAAIAYIRSEL